MTELEECIEQGDAKHDVVVAEKFGETKLGEYKVMTRTAQYFGGKKFGMMVDKDGNDIDVSHNPDFSSLLTAYNDKIYMVTHFEWPAPGAVYLSEVTQDAAGELKVESTSPVDFSGVHGVWIPCAGSVSTWGSHLGSEEYEPNAKEFFMANDDDGATVLTTTQLKDHKYWANQAVPDFMKYYGATTENRVAMTGKQAVEVGFNPYHYGYSWELKVGSSGEAIVNKHYANGRMAYELIYAMPDKKTVYGTDDGTDVMFSKFVTKKAGDMSEGELFCAKYLQTSPEPGGDANDFHATVTYISMGSASDADILEGDFSIKKFNGTEKMTSFYDMWEVGEVDDDGKGCKKDGFKLIKQGGVGVECLKLRKDKWDEERSEKIAVLASRLEKRRYAAYIGCNTEGRKWEGK